MTNINRHAGENTFSRYALVVEYIGSAYAGSQIQPGQKTIQSELESALCILTKLNVKTVFSGRTDSGVNSKGQVIHFDLPFKIDSYKFIYSLNAILPPDISISRLQEVDREFHSQKSALYRWYRYIINNKSQRSVWLNDNAVHIQAKLDVKEMNRAIKYLLGSHDFSSFKSANSTTPNNECTMYHAECKSESDIIYIDLVANRFLYNMVRIIVGTLISIGKGILPAEHMLYVLEAKDRTKAGITARADGLTFMQVSYGDKYRLFDCLKMEALYNENLLCKAS